MTLVELEKLCYEDWIKVLNPGELECDIRRQVREELQEGGANEYHGGYCFQEKGRRGEYVGWAFQGSPKLTSRGFVC